ncbi:MAG: hypothetical protein IJ634_03810 [Bacteroidales bacterium]|nr:hypothetical protein [Bacteroidales bacterium]
MKKTILIALAIIFNFQFSIFNSAYAQAPQGFTYQAAVRDAQGHAVANRTVAVRISLVQGNALGAERYAELHNPTTDAAGLFSITVGQGTSLVNTTMELAIDWADGPWFLKTQIDPDGGNVFTLSTTQQLMSVPYALYAANAGGRDTVHVRDSVVVHVMDSTVVHVVDSVVVHVHDSVVVYIRDSVEVHYDTTAFAADTVWMTDSIEGMLPGRFSINGLEQVSFSCGNVQFRRSDTTYRFAEHQYDALGSLNNNYQSSTYDGWIDLMMCNIWGNGDAARSPISNGGDAVGLWRVLSKDEWTYILRERTNAISLRTFATVAGVPGLVLLPDDWQLPDGISMVISSQSMPNTYTAAQWAILEAAGAVFLPAAGVSYDASSTSYMGESGRYASNSFHSAASQSHYVVYFSISTTYSTFDETSTISNTTRVSIRLAHDIPRF